MAQAYIYTLWSDILPLTTNTAGIGDPIWAKQSRVFVFSPELLQ